MKISGSGPLSWKYPAQDVSVLAAPLPRTAARQEKGRQIPAGLLGLAEEIAGAVSCLGVRMVRVTGKTFSLNRGYFG